MNLKRVYIKIIFWLWILIPYIHQLFKNLIYVLPLLKDRSSSSPFGANNNNNNTGNSNNLFGSSANTGVFGATNTSNPAGGFGFGSNNSANANNNAGGSGGLFGSIKLRNLIKKN